MTPTINANWDVSKTMEALDTPIEGGHGEQITERVAEVVLHRQDRGGRRLPRHIRAERSHPCDAAGTTLYFPTIQTCEEGETAWIEIPAEGQDRDDLESPAPGVAVVDAEVAGDGQDDGAEVTVTDTAAVTETTASP